MAFHEAQYDFFKKGNGNSILLLNGSFMFSDFHGDGGGEEVLSCTGKVFVRPL
jgi:hypothetical protein